jgi:hypothetical protein
VSGDTIDTGATIHLVRTEENVADIDAAEQRHGPRVGLAGVLADLNRQATAAHVPGLAVEWGFVWNDRDHGSERWWPQGVTTSADASDTEVVEGRRLLVASWYSKNLAGENHGSRITVVDLDTLQYRHVLLVVPRRRRRSGHVDLEPLMVHAGGLAWCGPYLHVAATRSGLFTCRLDDIIRVDSTEGTFGYPYVLPVRFTYESFAAESVEPMRYSFVSLDRGTEPPHLLAGEYGRGEQTRRLVRFPLDATTFHLAAHEDGTSRPVDLDERGLGHMQGAVTVRGTYYVSVSRGRYLLGRICSGVPGAFRSHPWTMPVGPEDLSYWPSSDLLWSVTEYPRRRYVFAMRRSRFD